MFACTCPTLARLSLCTRVYPDPSIVRRNQQRSRVRCICYRAHSTCRSLTTAPRLRLGRCSTRALLERSTMLRAQIPLHRGSATCCARSRTRSTLAARAVRRRDRMVGAQMVVELVVVWKMRRWKCGGQSGRVVLQSSWICAAAGRMQRTRLWRMPSKRSKSRNIRCECACVARARVHGMHVASVQSRVCLLNEDVFTRTHTRTHKCTCAHTQVHEREGDVNPKP